MRTSPEMFHWLLSKLSPPIDARFGRRDAHVTLRDQQVMKHRVVLAVVHLQRLELERDFRVCALGRSAFRHA